jgi:hypothetical protein
MVKFDVYISCHVKSEAYMTVDCLKSELCGVLFDIGLKEAVESATFSYKFKFSAGYEWTAGGKMPGVCDSGALCRSTLYQCFTAFLGSALTAVFNDDVECMHVAIFFEACN